MAHTGKKPYRSKTGKLVTKKSNKSPVKSSHKSAHKKK